MVKAGNGVLNGQLSERLGIATQVHESKTDMIMKAILNWFAHHAGQTDRNLPSFEQLVERYNLMSQAEQRRVLEKLDRTNPRMARLMRNLNQAEKDQEKAREITESLKRSLEK